jgi:hypothetical protein
MVLTTTIGVFCDLMPCSLVNDYQSFGSTLNKERKRSSETLVTRLQCFTSNKTLKWKQISGYK